MMKRLTCVAVSALALTLLASAIVAAAPGYLVQADLVRSAEGAPAGPVCVPTSVFLPGEGVVFRAKVYDLATGEEVDRAAVESRGIRVQAHLSDGQTIHLIFIPHPPDPNAPLTDEYWTGLWIIPADYAAGVINWTLSVTDNEGRTGSFEPIGQNIGIPALMVIPGGAGPNPAGGPNA